MVKLNLLDDTPIGLPTSCTDWFLDMVNIRVLSRLTLFSLILTVLVIFDTAAQSRVIHLVNTGWHVGIVLPVNTILKRNLPETKHFPDSNFLEVGWGDARFYKSNTPTTLMAFEAAFTSEGSVMHVYAFQSSVKETFAGSEILKLKLTAEEYSKLLSFIHRSFVRNANGDARAVGSGLYGEEMSRFYLSGGEFHLFNTCNTWVAEALESAELEIISQGIITADNLMEKVGELSNIVD